MAFTFDNNFTPTTGAEVIYRLKTLLKGTLTWILKGNGDGGTNVSNVADTTTTAAGTDYLTSAGVMATSKAWWRVRKPGAAPSQEFIAQRATASNAQWRIKYSPAAGFIGGSASATQVPSATDEVVLCGGGTDASPTFTAIFSTDNTYRCHIGADSASPYGWFLGTYPNGGGTPNGAWLFDPVTGTTTGEVDPYMIYLSQNTGTAFKGSTAAQDFASESIASSPKGFLKVLAAANYVIIPPLSLFSALANVAVPNGMPVNPNTNNDDEFPFVYGRRAALAAPNGSKGVSSLMRWTAIARTTGDTQNAATSKDRIVLGDVTLPWDGSSPLI